MSTINNPAAGGGGGSLTITEAEIDFGTTPCVDAVFTVTAPGMTPASKILVVQSGAAATGQQQDESEMEGLVLAPVAGTGQFTLYARPTTSQLVTGKFKINYTFA